MLEPLLKSADAAAKVDKKPSKATLEVIDWTKPAERVTVWWQVLAFLVITIAEVLISMTGLELAFVAAPQTMKSFVTACWLAVVFLANLLINAPITQLYPRMAPGRVLRHAGRGDGGGDVSSCRLPHGSTGGWRPSPGASAAGGRKQRATDAR